jgi:hypothetical protein
MVSHPCYSNQPFVREMGAGSIEDSAWQLVTWLILSNAHLLYIHTCTRRKFWRPGFQRLLLNSNNALCLGVPCLLESKHFTKWSVSSTGNQKNENKLTTKCKALEWRMNVETHEKYSHCLDHFRQWYKNSPSIVNRTFVGCCFVWTMRMSAGLERVHWGTWKLGNKHGKNSGSSEVE